MIGIPEIGIVDTRNIVKTIKENYKYDFSEFALTSFKRRVEQFIYNENVKSVDAFLLKLGQNNDFFEHFLMTIQVEGTEMFRDPSLWRWLRDDFFPNHVQPEQAFKIWMPECVSGESLYTLMIVLNECGMTDKVEVTATSITETCIDKINSGYLHLKKYENSYENYKRYQGAGIFNEYVCREGSAYKMNHDLLDSVSIQKHHIISDPPLRNIDLIIYRNRMIYFNPALQNKVLENIYKSLHYGGYLVVGVNEDISGFSNGKFSPEYINENVFKRR